MPIGYRRSVVFSLLAAITVALTAKADSVIEIWENDGHADIYGDPAELKWRYVVRNNSDYLPQGNPWNEICNKVRFNVYSVAEPDVVSIPLDWEGQVTLTGQNLWEVEVYEWGWWNFIYPGEEKVFVIDTYRPVVLPDVTGTCYGQGNLEAAGWAPVPPDDFIGPAGVRGDRDREGDADLKEHGESQRLFAGWSRSRAVSIIDIWENDGQPIVPPTEPDTLWWTFIAKNNSDTEPPGNPYNEWMTAVAFYDLYSVQEPLIGAIPYPWTGTVTPGSGPNLWDVMVSTVDDEWYISPGSQRGFDITTYRPVVLPDVTGTAYGQGRLEIHSWQPVPPDDFLGPTGIRGDLDRDGDFDLDDHGLFADCLTGPGYQAGLDFDCQLGDLDRDGDVDLQDHGEFQRLFP